MEILGLENEENEHLNNITYITFYKYNIAFKNECISILSDVLY